MGRTLPTFRQLIDDAIARWSKFRRALRREDQEYFDRLFRHVRSYTQAATYQASDNPMEAILLSIALDQEKRLDVLERAVQPPEVPAGVTFTLNAASESCSLPEPDTALTSTLDAPAQLGPASPLELSADCIFTPNDSGESCSPPEAGAGSTHRRHSAGRSRRSALAEAAGASVTCSPQETGVGSTWSPPEAGVGSTWSPPEEYLEQPDVPRSVSENEQPGTDPPPDAGQLSGTGQQRSPGRQRHTHGQPDTTAWLDFRSLPEPARDEAVADRAEPETPPAD